MVVFLRCSKGARHTHLFSHCWDRKEAIMLEMFTIKMIMVDELGCDVIVDTFTISSELDSDYLEVWKEMKIAKARERYPEARGFYFEDSRDIQSDDYSSYDWEEKSLDDMVLCDYRGICAGISCPMYWKCQH